MFRPFQVFSMFSVHPKIKNLSFYQVKTNRWVEKNSSLVSLMECFITNKTLYHDHSNLSCTTFICHCNLALNSLFCIHVTQLESDEYFVLCFFIISIKIKVTNKSTNQVCVECTNKRFAPTGSINSAVIAPAHLIYMIKLD